MSQLNIFVLLLLLLFGVVVEESIATFSYHQESDSTGRLLFGRLTLPIQSIREEGGVSANVLCYVINKLTHADNKLLLSI